MESVWDIFGQSAVGPSVTMLQLGVGTLGVTLLSRPLSSFFVNGPASTYISILYLLFDTITKNNIGIHMS